MGVTWGGPIPRVEVLRRLADLTVRVEHTNAICPSFIREELDEIEELVASIELSLSNQIDNLMAARYREFNVPRRCRFEPAI